MIFNVQHSISYLILCVCALLGAGAINAQIISTVAGQVVTKGYSGDGGLAINAEMQPNLLKVDKGGNLYISETNNYCVRKVSPIGIITTIAGGAYGYAGDGGPATNALMGNITGIAVDAAGNIYISDENHYSVRKIDPAGIITTIAGTGIGGYSGNGGPATAATFWQPRGIDVDRFGNIFIADHVSNVVRKINTAGIISTVAGVVVGGGFGDDIPATTCHLRLPDDVLVDISGKLYIGDQGDNRIRMVDTFGIIHTYAGGGSVPYSGGRVPATSVSLGATDYMAMDDTGSLYFTDVSGLRAFRVDTSGMMVCIAGTGTSGVSVDGIPATTAALSAMSGIAVGCDGTWYLTDNYRVRTIADPNRRVRFTAGLAHKITVCENSGPYSIDSFLSIVDSDLAQTETWGLMRPPHHGSVTSYIAAVSPGDTLTPSGLNYQPAAGYSGTDTFKIVVSDCGRLYDTTAVYVTVLPHSACAAGIADIQDDKTGKSQVSLWPNPNNGIFNINVSADNEQYAHLMVANMIGKTVQELTVATNKVVAFGLQQPPGIYFVSVVLSAQRYTLKIEVMP